MKLLKEYRQEKGMTQIELAYKLGMSYQNLRNYDCGNYKTMTPEIQKKVSEVLGVEYVYYNKDEVKAI